MTSISNRITVTELTTLEEWDAISRFWDELVVSCQGASVFNSYSYLRSLYTRFLDLPSCKPAILILKNETGKPIGAAPMIRFKRWMAGFPVKVISLMYKQVLTDRTQFLLPCRQDEQLQAILNYIRDDSGNWDVFELLEQVIDEEFESNVSSIFKDSYNYHHDLIYPAIEPFLKMDFGPNGWEKYLMTRSKKHRKKWRNLQNRLTREGTVTITRHTGDEDLDPFVTEYRELEQKSRKVNNPSALSPEIRAFYVELATALRPKGNMHFVFLRLDDVPIAGLIGMSFADRYAALHTVFDENYSNNSAGFLVGGYDMKWAMENGYSEYDFMSGFITDKMLWTDSYRRLHSLRLVRKRAFSGFFYLTKFRIMPVLHQILEKIGLKSSLEKLLGHKSWVQDRSKFEKHNFQLDIYNENSEVLTTRRTPLNDSNSSE
jgi:hypothetical protein